MEKVIFQVWLTSENTKRAKSKGVTSWVRKSEQRQWTVCLRLFWVCRIRKNVMHSLRMYRKWASFSVTEIWSGKDASWETYLSGNRREDRSFHRNDQPCEPFSELWKWWLRNGVWPNGQIRDKKSCMVRVRRHEPYGSYFFFRKSGAGSWSIRRSIICFFR